MRSTRARTRCTRPRSTRLICPSSPGPATINYFNAFWGPYGDGGGDVCTPGVLRPGGSVSEPQSAPDPDLGPDRLLPDPGPAQHGPPGRGDEPGLHRRGRRRQRLRHHHRPPDHGHDPHGLDHRRHLQHDDGLGVRIKADRLQRLPADLQVRRSMACPSTGSSSPSAAPAGPGPTTSPTPAWPAPRDGKTASAAARAWSTARATTRSTRSTPAERTALFVDGSVHFIKDVASVPLIAALVTRAGGEIISADQY